MILFLILGASNRLSPIIKDAGGRPTGLAPSLKMQGGRPTGLAPSLKMPGVYCI
jgi:hypothetical protein